MNENESVSLDEMYVKSYAWVKNSRVEYSKDKNIKAFDQYLKH